MDKKRKGTRLNALVSICDSRRKELKKFWKTIRIAALILPCLYIFTTGTTLEAFSIFPLRQAPHPLYAPQELIVRFVDWINDTEAQNILDLIGVKERRRLHHSLPLFAIKLPLTCQVEETADLLQLLPLVRYAEPNFYVEAEFIPNDPIYIYQWHMGMINMETAWDIHDGTGAVVAILDTGAAYRNALPYGQAPDLAGTAFVPGWDFVNDDPFPDDDHGHGTHITGTIAQTTNNLLGCAGVAYSSAIMPVKVLDENSNGLLDDVVAGFYFAVDNGAQIINTSFGTVTPSLILEEAVEYVALNKVTIICSAGNGASSAPHYPSSYPDCISVSAIKYDQTLAFYSNYGTDIDLCAPGGSLAYDQNLDGKPDGIVQQTHNGIDYQSFDFYIYQGTSCAAAHVTGVVALIVGATGGALGPDLIRSTLASTAVDLGDVGWDEYFGAGMVNAAAALASLPLIATAASSAPLQPFIPPPVPSFSFGPEFINSAPIGTPVFSLNNQWNYFQGPAPPIFQNNPTMLQRPFYPNNPFPWFPLNPYDIQSNPYFNIPAFQPGPIWNHSPPLYLTSIRMPFSYGSAPWRIPPIF